MSGIRHGKSSQRDSRIADWDYDPLEEDDPNDPEITTTRRRLLRLVAVAVEAGARQQRESVSVDALAWMLIPLRLLDGSPPIAACMGLSQCRNALYLLALGREPGVAVNERNETAAETRDAIFADPSGLAACVPYPTEAAMDVAYAAR